MDNAGVLNFNRAELSEHSSCTCSGDVSESASTSAAGTPVKPRLGRFLDVYSPEHLNLTPQPFLLEHRDSCAFTQLDPMSSKDKTKLLFNQIRNEGPITLTPEKYYDSDYEYKCRTVKGERRFRRVYEECSFEGNQSFPRVRRRDPRSSRALAAMDPVADTDRDLLRVDGPNGLRFNSVLGGPSAGDGAGAGGGGSPAPSPAAALQPPLHLDKAVFTIEPHSSKILIVNSAACSLLGYSAGELGGVRFAELVRGGGGALTERGGGGGGSPAVLLSGKVVELLRKEGGSVQVSLWVRQLEAEGPRLVVAEPVTARSLVLTVDPESGAVRAVAGADAAAVFGADCADRLLGLPVAQLIPSIRLPPSPPGSPLGDAPEVLSKQKATGRTLDGGCFPLCLWISAPAATATSTATAPCHGKTKENNKEKRLLDVNVRVTYNVSGLLVVDEGGVVSACNRHFAELTFGKQHHEVVGRRIDTLIRNFCRDTDVLRLDLDPDLDPDPDPDPDPDLATRDDTDMTLSPLDHRTRDRESASEGEEEEEEELVEGSQRSACTSLNVQRSATATATPTQDMVSSLADTSSPRLPDLVAALSVSEATLPPTPPAPAPTPAVCKSRSESVLRRDRPPAVAAEGAGAGGGSDSVSCGPQSTPRAPAAPDPGSDETSADFLTPINEMPPPPPELELDPDPAEAGATSTPARGCGGGGGGGTYRGTALHADGTELPVVYTVSTLRVAGGARVRCVWLGVALGASAAPRHASASASASAATPDSSLVLAGLGPGAPPAPALAPAGPRSSRASSRASRPPSMSLASQADRDDQIAGDYSKHYVTLKQIGKGAFGCVKMAYRRSDRLLAVTKFILKEKVGAQFWVDAPDGRRLPLELSLLLTLKHPNIVSVMDVFENDKYFQMVMEKHGAGMDLFEFIERRPRLDEPLLAYIYRQICEAVAYLHSLNVLHRDIKDENVIIDDKFHVKLIDFGSAAFRATDGTTFGTFYGTTEYCSPEVLAGNRYAGPELEVWAMGVTLYVLAFGRAPFADMEDTVRGALALPPAPPARRPSPPLEALLRAALARDPAARITVPQLVRHPWVTQPVAIDTYAFHEVVECSPSEAAPETHYAGPSRRSLALARPAPLEDSLRSSADLLEGEGEVEMTSLSEDATGHAAADIDIDLDRDHLDPDPDLDSWDECEAEADQDSFS